MHEDLACCERRSNDAKQVVLSMLSSCAGHPTLRSTVAEAGQTTLPMIAPGEVEWTFDAFKVFPAIEHGLQRP